MVLYSQERSPDRVVQNEHNRVLIWGLLDLEIRLGGRGGMIILTVRRMGLLQWADEEKAQM